MPARHLRDAGQRVVEVLADGAVRAHLREQLGPREQGLAVGIPRHLPQRDTRVEDHPGRGDVDGEVVLGAGRAGRGNGEAVVLRAADPDEGEALGDAGLEEVGAGDLGEAGAAGEVERQVGIVAHGLRDDRIRRGRASRRIRVGHAEVGAGDHGHGSGSPEEGQHLLGGGRRVVGGLLRWIERIARPQVRPDDRADLDRRREQVVHQLHQAVGIAGEVVVDDDAGARRHHTAKFRLDRGHRWHPSLPCSRNTSHCSVFTV